MLSHVVAFTVCFALAAGVAIHDVSPQTWNQLNKTVGGRLHVAVPFARPCFSTSALRGNFDAVQCSSVMRGYTDPGVRVGVMGSYMNTEWETCQATSQQCLLDFTNVSNSRAFLPPQSCAQGSIPPYYIDVRLPSDVQAAFAFSKKTQVPVIVKNTGHDYSGRSSGANALALWTHNLQNISFHPAFVPAGCRQSSPGVTFGSGVNQGQLYDFADAHKITLPGGGERSVAAAGGYLHGGGHSALSNAFGLAVDRVLEVKIVTPRGDYLTANACQNTDLFFAVRGGGGGTFGVVMEATMRALPAMSFPTVFMDLTKATPALEREFMQLIVANALKWAETGWGGYISLTNIIYVNPMIDAKRAAKEMAPLKAFADKTPGAVFNLTVEPSFLSFFNDYLLLTGVPVGLPFATTSRLIPADNFKSARKQAELLDRLLPVLNNSPLPLIFAVGTYFFKDSGGASINPAWRESLWHVTASTFWNFETTLAEKRAIYANMTSEMNLLREITPGSGAYLNEADVHEPSPAQSYWGSNYDRLVQIKRKYDPDHLLDCWQCVDTKGRQSPRFSCYI